MEGGGESISMEFKNYDIANELAKTPVKGKHVD